MAHLGSNVQKHLVGQETTGAIGSVISDFLYNEDYLAKLNTLSIRANEYERMSNGDPVIRGLLRASKNPILHASWNIVYEDEEFKNEEILDYLNHVFFHDLNLMGGKLFEMLTFMEYGFSYFEKIFRVKEHPKMGRIVTVALPIRLQKTIIDFLLLDKAHPDRITHVHQQTSNGNRSVDAEIPVENMLIFVMDQIGNDITGKAMLRSCYKPWIQKDLIEKLQMIGIERMALGTPKIKIPENFQPNDLKNVKEAIESYMGHEKSGIFLPHGFEADILEGKLKSEAIDSAINQKNTEMTLSFLAQFLMLGQFGNGGSYALGQDQSDFFLNSLEYISGITTRQLNMLIKQLVLMQFGEQEAFPVFEVKGINNKASKEFAETLKTLTEAGVLTPDEKLAKWVRDLYKMPEMSELTDALPKVEPKKEEPTEKEIEDNKEDAKEEVKEDNVQASELEKKNSEINLYKFADFAAKEKNFIGNVTKNEEFIEGFYQDKYVPLTEELESRIKKILENGYAKAKTEFRGGTEYLTTAGNAGVRNDMAKKIKDQFKKYQTKVFSPGFMDKLMGGALKNSQETIKEFVNIQLFFVSKSQAESFKRGHISNMEGVIFNEQRRMLETLDANFGSELSMTVIKDQIKTVKLNRNILKLSVVTHPRALYKNNILQAAKERGIQFHKMVIPKGVKLNPAGETIKNVFIIRTLLEWEKMLKADQNSGGVVGGLGIHHNSVEYFEPIQDNEMEEAKALSKEQRQNLDKLSK